MLLKVGSQGDDVVKLQIKLGVDPIGKFGPKTEAAVKGWQTAHGLTPDGIVGDATWAKLFAPVVETPVAPIIVAPVATIEPKPLKLDKLKGHVPQFIIDQIPDTAQRFGITTPLRLAHFLAQTHHETGGFRLFTENLNYSAKGLMGIFRKYFPSVTIALQYERRPEKIANKVYANRMGNGPESSGDGWKHRGRGALQTTGKSNYQEFADFMKMPMLMENPDLVATNFALASAGFFFKKNNLWVICDRGSSKETVIALRKRVNGGLIGIDDVQKHFDKFFKLLS
jgi:putative chitinase